MRHVPRIFITAFEPYEGWSENSSWLALVEFTKELTSHARITTRRYPVNFDVVRERLASDLAEDYDYALHLGQAPGSASIRLEAIGLNVGGHSDERPEVYRPLVADGPVAYRSTLPLDAWSEMLRMRGIPATVSYHAGTFLCNATLYLAHYYIERQNLSTQAAFIHMPLDYSQTVRQPKEVPALASHLAGEALRLIAEQLVKRVPSRATELA